MSGFIAEFIPAIEFVGKKLLMSMLQKLATNFISDWFEDLEVEDCNELIFGNRNALNTVGTVGIESSLRLAENDKIIYKKKEEFDKSKKDYENILLKQEQLCIQFLTEKNKTTERKLEWFEQEIIKNHLRDKVMQIDMKLKVLDKLKKANMQGKMLHGCQTSIM